MNISTNFIDSTGGQDVVDSIDLTSLSPPMPSSASSPQDHVTTSSCISGSGGNGEPGAQNNGNHHGADSRSNASSTPSPLVDEDFLKHYNVKEIQSNTVNSLVDEEFLRHYRVDEIAASMGITGQYTGNYGYDYFMGTQPSGEYINAYDCPGQR